MSDPANEHQSALAHREVVEPLWTAPVYEACGITEQSIDPGVSVLVAESRCGYIPVTWAPTLPEDVRVIALDPSRAMLDQARQRIDEELARRVFFVPQRSDNLTYADDVFRTSLCLNGLTTMRHVREATSELARVTQQGGSVIVATPLRECFSEFYDIFDEALRAHHLHDVLGRLHQLQGSFMTPGRLASVAEDAGLHDPQVHEVSWDVEFESGQHLLMSPLVRETYFPQWIGVVRSSDREPVLRYIADAIDMYWHDRPFVSQMRAGVLRGMV